MFGVAVGGSFSIGDYFKDERPTCRRCLAWASSQRAAGGGLKARDLIINRCIHMYIYIYIYIYILFIYLLSMPRVS